MILTKESNTTIQSYNTAELWLISNTTIPSYNQCCRAMAYLREILNHTFLRTIFHTSSRKAELECQEVQRNFINDHSNDDPDDQPTKFTALIISRVTAYAAITRLCKAYVIPSARWWGIKIKHTLLDRLQSFVPLVSKHLTTKIKRRYEKTISSIR